MLDGAAALALHWQDAQANWRLCEVGNNNALVISNNMNVACPIAWPTTLADCIGQLHAFQEGQLRSSEAASPA